MDSTLSVCGRHAGLLRPEPAVAYEAARDGRLRHPSRGDQAGARGPRAARPERFEPVVVVTGQHREMLDQVNTFFGITPDVDLDLMSHGASRQRDHPPGAARDGDPVLRLERPDAVVVQGDTTSAFAASLAALPGRASPSSTSRPACAPATCARRSPRRPTVGSPAWSPTCTWPRRRPHARNLERENVDPATILVTGNTVVDALQWAVQQPVTFSDRARGRAWARERGLVLVTTHRRESWGSRWLQAMDGLGDVARAHPELDFLLPLHRNQVVRDAVVAALGGAGQRRPHRAARVRRVRARDEAVPPRGHRLRRRAGGGAQPRQAGAGAARHDRASRGRRGRRPCVSSAPTATSVRDEIERLLTDAAAYDVMAHAVNPYGDGHAAAARSRRSAPASTGPPLPAEFSPPRDSMRTRPRTGAVRSAHD